MFLIVISSIICQQLTRMRLRALRIYIPILKAQFERIIRLRFPHKFRIRNHKSTRSSNAFVVESVQLNQTGFDGFYVLVKHLIRKNHVQYIYNLFSRQNSFLQDKKCYTYSLLVAIPCSVKEDEILMRGGSGYLQYLGFVQKFTFPSELRTVKLISVSTKRSC